MDALMNPAHLIQLDHRLPQIVQAVDVAGRSGQGWLATWRSVAPTLLVITGSSAEHPRLRSREALPKLKDHLTSVWLRGSNPGPLPSCEWEANDAAAQGVGR
jgi:hypothetical protein